MWLDATIRSINQGRHKTSVPDQPGTIKVYLNNLFRDHGQREFGQAFFYSTFCAGRLGLSYRAIVSQWDGTMSQMPQGYPADCHMEYSVMKPWLLLISRSIG